MAGRDDYEEYEETFSPEPKKAGMSTAMKVLLVLLVGGGLAVVLCCGGAFWFGSRAFQTTTVPAEVVAKSNEIADVAIPETFKPTMAMTFNLGVSMKMAVFARNNNPENGGALILMQMSGPGMDNEQQMKQQFQTSMQQQGQNQNITVEEQETRPFTIDGEEVEFEFIKGKNPENGAQVRQVQGVFSGRGGTAFLMIMENEEDWDEDQVVAIIESLSAK